jgi:hypothetical protein
MGMKLGFSHYVKVRTGRGGGEGNRRMEETIRMQLHNMYCSPNIIVMARWVRHVARKGQTCTNSFCRKA